MTTTKRSTSAVCVRADSEDRLKRLNIECFLEGHVEALGAVFGVGACTRTTDVERLAVVTAAIDGDMPTTSPSQAAQKFRDGGCGTLAERLSGRQRVSASASRRPTLVARERQEMQLIHGACHAGSARRKVSHTGHAARRPKSGGPGHPGARRRRPAWARSCARGVRGDVRNAGQLLSG